MLPGRKPTGDAQETLAVVLVPLDERRSRRREPAEDPVEVERRIPGADLQRETTRLVASSTFTIASREESDEGDRVIGRQIRKALVRKKVRRDHSRAGWQGGAPGTAERRERRRGAFAPRRSGFVREDGARPYGLGPGIERRAFDFRDGVFFAFTRRFFVIFAFAKYPDLRRRPGVQRRRRPGDRDRRARPSSLSRDSRRLDGCADR